MLNSKWTFAAAVFLFAGFWTFVFLTPSRLPTLGARKQVGMVQEQVANGAGHPYRYGSGTKESPFVVQVERPPETEAEAEKDADYRERKTADDRTVWWAGLAVWVGLAQAVALFSALILSASVAIRQLRAYMYAEITGIKSFHLPRDVAILIDWRNSGQTPARHFETHGSVFVAQLPLPDNIDFEAGGPTEPEDIGRHGKPAVYPGTVSKSDWPLTPGEEIGPVDIAQLRSGERALYAAGAAHYRDIFGRRRVTRVCRFIDPVCMAQFLDALDGNGAPPPMINWVVAHVLNDFT
jgi:hypothetical protein